MKIPVATPSLALISTLTKLIFNPEIDSVISFKKCFLSSPIIFNLTINDSFFRTSHSTFKNLSSSFKTGRLLQFPLCTVIPLPLVMYPIIGSPGIGTSGMDAQSIAHLVIVLFIIFGNIAYFIEVQRAKKY